MDSLTGCLFDGCRFSRGYVPDVTLGPLTRAPTLPTVFVFETDKALGYRHYRKHFPGLTGIDVLEQLRMAWTSATHTVLREREKALIWVVDHEAFDRVFDSERVNIITKACSGYSEVGHHCCKGCARTDRPDRTTVRSVRPWSQVRANRRVLHTDLPRTYLPEYLSEQPDRWIGVRAAIDSSQAFENPWQKKFHYRVQVIVDGTPATVRVVATKEQSELIDANEAGFAGTHDVIFTSRLPSGQLKASFVRR